MWGSPEARQRGVREEVKEFHVAGMQNGGGQWRETSLDCPEDSREPWKVCIG